jgi:hypothetical protein
LTEAFRNLFQTTWLFFDRLLCKFFFFLGELGWSATTGLIIETCNPRLFPFLDPGGNGISIHLIYGYPLKAGHLMTSMT